MSVTRALRVSVGQTPISAQEQEAWRRWGASMAPPSPGAAPLFLVLGGLGLGYLVVRRLKP